MPPTRQQIDNGRWESSPDRQKYRKNYPDEEYYEDRDSSPRKYSRNTGNYRRGAPYQHRGHRPFCRNRGNNHQSRFQHSWKSTKRNYHPNHGDNTQQSPFQDRSARDRESQQDPRHRGPKPRSSYQDRHESREVPDTSVTRNPGPRSAIQSESSSAVPRQTPSMSAPPPDQNAAGNGPEPISESDKDGSQGISPEQNATSQTVLPSPEQASSSSVQVNSQSNVNNASENPPKKSSNSSRNGTKSLPSVVQSVTDNAAKKTEHQSSHYFNGKSTYVKVFTGRDRNLINIVRKFSVLWDPDDDWFKDKTRMDEAWAAISKEFKWPVEDCKKRWTSLRREHNRITGKQILGKNPSYHSEFMDAMNFLPKKPSKKKHFGKQHLAGDCGDGSSADGSTCVSKYSRYRMYSSHYGRTAADFTDPKNFGIG